MLCPCGSEKDSDQCCVPFIEGKDIPPTAEALMRSRYTAFVQGDWGYIERTQLPDPQDPFDAEETAKFAKECEFRGLTIRSAAEKADSAEIEFAVRFRIKGQDILQTERSTFRREDGRWLYVSGEINPKQMPVRNESKIRRNDPCPCGSGKKAKKCCGTERL